MKTTLFLFAALFISTITFSQTKKSERKGYTYYKAKSDLSKSQNMNKGELIDAMAKDANSRKKNMGKMGNHPNTTQASHNWVNSNSRAQKKHRKAQGDPIPNIDITLEQGYQDGDDLILRKRPGRAKYANITLERGHLDEDSDDDGILDGDDLLLRKRPGRTTFKGYTNKKQNTKSGVRGWNPKNKAKKVAKFKAGKALADTVKNH